MEKYSQISGLYLRFQKKRSIFTILGVALASGVLFVILTLFFSNFINERDKLRKDADYEMVFFVNDDTELKRLIDMDFVKSAKKGDYYNAYDNSYINNAIYVNVKNPYRINKNFDEIKESIGIEGYINEELAGYYLQGDIGNVNYIMCLMFLAVAFIFAIIGVGIIRNSIQLTSLEQVKDYGILRCIGATKGQLSNIIYKMGFLLEFFGVVLGMTCGYLVSLVIGFVKHIKVGLHVLPVAFVLIAFFGDLIFAMSENVKQVKSLTPVEAVRGRLSVRKKKVKAVKRKNVFGILFGVEGDYAYKSLMGNKGRFYKSLCIFGFGISAMVICSALFTSVRTMKNGLLENFGEYELYYYEPVSVTCDVAQAQSFLPPSDVLNGIAASGNVSDVKAMYTAYLNVADYENYISKYNKEFLNDSVLGHEISNMLREKEKKDPLYLSMQLPVFGYDEEEYKQYEDLLIDGTLDVSENGIVLAVSCRSVSYEHMSDDEMALSYEDIVGKEYTILDYKVGDTIDIINFQRFKTLYKEELEEYERLHKNELDDNRIYELEIYTDVKNKLIEEGDYKTYTVEGLVKYDKDKIEYNISFGQGTIILPLERFYSMTGLTEADTTGVKFKLKGNVLTADEEELYNGLYLNYNCVQSEYINVIPMIVNAGKQVRNVMLFVVFIMVMSSVNIINTTASNIYLRRQELAQLRAIGVSKKKLTYMVMLEGIITTICANFIGCLLGFGFLKLGEKSISVMFQLKMSYQLGAALFGLIFSAVVMCGSIFFTIHRMNEDILNDLNAGGD